MVNRSSSAMGSGESPSTRDVRLLVVSTHHDLVDALEQAIPDHVEMKVVSAWSDAETVLVEQAYQLVCLDYEDVKIEGIDSFIYLNNILNKGGARGMFVVRSPSPRARELYETLETFEAQVVTDPSDGPDDDRLREALSTLLKALPEEENEASTASSSSDGTSTTVRLDASPVSEGHLSETPLIELLHRLHVREDTGRLQLSHDAIERTYVFDEGELVETGRSSELSTLPPTFAWEEGRYQFVSRSTVEGRASELYGWMLSGLHDHLSQKAALDALVPRMADHPVRTERWKTYRDAFDDDAQLQQFMSACGGDETLEQVLSVFGANARRGFQAAYFAIETDMVHLFAPDDVPEGRVDVVYEIEGDEDVDETQPRAPDTETDDESVGGDAGRTPSSSASSTTSEREIREAYEYVQTAHPHELFDLWEGCGGELVQKRFYELVKEYHPDTYGDLPDELDSIAQEMFVSLKEAYSHLREVEDEQVVPPSQAESSPVLENSSEESVASLGGQASDVIASGEDRLDSGVHSTTLSPGESTVSASSVAVTEEGDEPSERGSFPNADRDRNSHAPAADETDAGAPSSDDGRSGSKQAESSVSERLAELSNVEPDLSSESETASGQSEASDADAETASAESDAEEASTDPPPVDDADNRAEKIERIRKRNQTPAFIHEKGGEPSDEEEAQELFNRGYKAFKNDSEEKAFDFVSRAHEFDPDNALYKTFCGYLLFLNEPDQREEAQALLEEAIELGDEQVLPDAHLFLGRLLRVKEQDRRARQHFKRALELNPESVEAKRELRVYELREGGDADSIVESVADEASEGDDEEETSFSEDPAGYIKNLLNKDLF